MTATLQPKGKSSRVSRCLMVNAGALFSDTGSMSKHSHAVFMPASNHFNDVVRSCKGFEHSIPAVFRYLIPPFHEDVVQEWIDDGEELPPESLVDAAVHIASSPLSCSTCRAGAGQDGLSYVESGEMGMTDSRNSDLICLGNNGKI